MCGPNCRVQRCRHDVWRRPHVKVVPTRLTVDKRGTVRDATVPTPQVSGAGTAHSPAILTESRSATRAWSLACGTEELREKGSRIELALLNRTQDAGEHGMELWTTPTDWR